MLNGYPGVGKSSVGSALRGLIPGSKFIDNHVLIDPVAALLERGDPGYRDLRKSFRTPILDSIANNPALRERTIITTYYQETFETREIDLKEYLETAKRGGRPFVVVVLRCSEKENTRRLVGRSPGSKSKLTDASILEDILQNHVVYSFYNDGCKSPDVWEYELDIEKSTPKEAASNILKLIKDVPGAHRGQNGH